MLFVDVLPRGEEPEEIGGGDRFDLLPEAIERVAVDAREKAAAAPARATLEPAAQDETLGLELVEQRIGR